MGDIVSLVVMAIFAATTDVSGVGLGTDDCQATVQEFSKGAKFVQVDTNPELQEVYYSLVGRKDVVYIVCGVPSPSTDGEDTGEETES